MASLNETPRVKPSLGCGYAVVGLIVLSGIGMLALAQDRIVQFGRTDVPEALIPLCIGFMLLVGSLLFLRFTRRAMRNHRAEEDLRAQFPGQPWKWKEKWSGSAIEANSGTQTATAWGVTLVWNTIAIPSAWAAMTAPHREKAALLVLILPGMGIILLLRALYCTLRWRKYGRARFMPASLPGVIGGYLAGSIEVPARVVLESEAKLKLTCVRRVTQGTGKRRHRTDHLLWEHEEWIGMEKWMAGPGNTRIPVRLFIPADCVASDDDNPDNKVCWRLSVEAATPGVDFATQFEVPVFATGETTSSPEESNHLSVEYGARTLDETALQRCGVRRVGNAFYFGTSHLPAMKAITAVLFLGIIGLLGWYTQIHAHGMVWAVTVFFGLIVSLFFFGVWFARFELQIDGMDVVLKKPRPWGTKELRFRRDEVQTIKANKSMSSGENQYYQLSLVGAEGIDTGVVASEGEPFRVRKLRYQLEHLKRQKQLTPEKVKELGGEIIEELKVHPKFIVPFASHIPGQSHADAVAELVMEAIKPFPDIPQ